MSSTRNAKGERTVKLESTSLQKESATIPDDDSGPGPLHIAFLLIILATSSSLSQSSIRPLFGPSLPSEWFITGLIVYTAVSVYTCPYNLSLHKNLLMGMAVMLLIEFRLAKFLGTWALDNIYDLKFSAMFVHALLGFPILGMGGGIWYRWMEKYSQQEEVTVAGAIISKLFGVVAVTALLHYLEVVVVAAQAALGYVSPSYLLTGLGFITFAYSNILPDSTLPARNSRSYLTSNIIPAAIVVPLILFVGTLKVEVPSGVTIVEETYSSSGFLQVGDVFSSGQSYRYLRQDAGIVGTIAIALDKSNPLKVNFGDPVQPISLLSDAAFLAAGVGSSKALVIGAGTGVATKSALAHGYNTTLIEADNATYSLLREHFRLPELESVHITDPVHYVVSRTWRRDVQDEDKFDIVIHNSFLGNVPPADSYTVNFWNDLKKLLKDDSVVAITFTGRKDAITFRIMLSTVLHVFGSCRVFQDGLSNHSPQVSTLTDFVVLCTPQDALVLRKAKASDFASSALTKSILTGLLKWEIDVDDIVEYEHRERLVLKGQDRGIGRWGQEILAENWKRSKSTIPESIWTIY